ncbi:MAG TPA: hypothetical protein VGX93_11050 [Chthoniobacterales bacterium]|jgi:hypothetical protein|nr:hypothetical protein [Chthoniobacterales bacterium]
MTFFLVYFGLCFLVAAVGKARPLGFWGYFFSSFLFTPLVGLLLLMAAGKKRVSYPDRE